MPIFEYTCRDCKHSFEALIIGKRKAFCPSCQGRKLEKKLSIFSAGQSSKSLSTSDFKSACGSCGDPRGPGSCGIN